MNTTIHMFSAGAATFCLQRFLGEIIDSMCLNYLGQKRGSYGVIFIYLFTFFYGMNYLDHRKRLNINYMVNVRDFNGEVFTNIVLTEFPHKVND